MSSRKSVDPKELIKMVRDSIEGYELNKDERFDYLKILKATNEFTEKLFEATIH
jgi:competence protein ComGC